MFLKINKKFYNGRLKPISLLIHAYRLLKYTFNTIFIPISYLDMFFFLLSELCMLLEVPSLKQLRKKENIFSRDRHQK